jgi:uncharacterized RDD family membrane protein YckC
MSGGGELRIDSATGVEVALPLAGAGARAFAFLVDWHIRVALALAWYGAGALLHSYATRGTPTLAAPFDPGASWFLGVIAPTALLYFAYHPLLELLLRGRTPGKRYAGLRIVTRDGRTPGSGALLVRNVFRLVDSFPGLYCVGLVATLLTREAVRVGDLAAGTVLVYERERAARGLPWTAAALATPRFAGVELAAELDQRWAELAPGKRADLARELLRRLGTSDADLAAADEATLRRRLGTPPVATAAAAPGTGR